MSEISRRHILQGAVVAGLAVTVPGWEEAAVAAPAPLAGELETLRNRWVDSLTGRHLIPASPATYHAAIAALDSGADTRLKAIAPTPTRYFRNRDWTTESSLSGNSNNMRLNFTDLAQLATAWATPTSRHHHSTAVRDAVFAGLDHMYRTIYNEKTVVWGNWSSWNIGATKPLADIMAIFRDEMSQSDIDRYCMALDHFIPNRDPRFQLTSAGGMGLAPDLWTRGVLDYAASGMVVARLFS